MERYLGRYFPAAYAFVRVLTGLMLACHGLAHTFGTFVPGMQTSMGSQTGVGGLIELVCGVLVAVGLFGGWAAFLASGTMAVAYFQYHVGKSGALLPIINHGEPAVLYCFVLLLIAFRGSGAYSVDGAINRNAPVLDRDRP